MKKACKFLVFLAPGTLVASGGFIWCGAVREVSACPSASGLAFQGQEVSRERCGSVFRAEKV